MKQLTLSFFIILTLGLYSCSDAKEDNLYFLPEDNYYVEDGTIISGIRWQSLEIGNYLDKGFTSQEEYDKSIKSVSSYDEILLSIELVYDNWGFHFIDKDKDKILQKELYSYLLTQGKIITDDSNNHIINGDDRGYGGYGREQYLTAYVNGKVEITCDKILFGLNPGKNLLNKLMILENYTCQPIGISPPYSIAHCYEIDDSLETSVFCDQAWLRFKYLLKFKELPNEKYNELTFHLRFPFIKEYASHYISTFMKGYENQSRYEELEYEAEVVVKFK